MSKKPDISQPSDQHTERSIVSPGLQAIMILNRLADQEEIVLDPGTKSEILPIVTEIMNRQDSPNPEAVRQVMPQEQVMITRILENYPQLASALISQFS